MNWGYLGHTRDTRVDYLCNLYTKGMVKCQGYKFGNVIVKNGIIMMSNIWHIDNDQREV